MKVGGILLVVAMLGTAKAESIRQPYAYVVGSSDRQHYFRMYPPIDGAKPHGEAFEVDDRGAETRQWTVEGWYSYDVYLVRGGHTLIRVGDWPISQDPAKTALVFYRDGKEVRSYSVKDLVPSGLKPMEDDWLSAVVGLDALEKRFVIRTSAGVEYCFDVSSGKILSKKPGK